VFVIFLSVGTYVLALVREVLVSKQFKDVFEKLVLSLVSYSLRFLKLSRDFLSLFLDSDLST